eukprot:8078382-Pyramimonas_sp.AAC.1
MVQDLEAQSGAFRVLRVRPPSGPDVSAFQGALGPGVPESSICVIRRLSSLHPAGARVSCSGSRGGGPGPQAAFPLAAR